MLNVRQVGLNDNFFELGGNSLIATRVVSRLNSALNIDVGVRVAGLGMAACLFLGAVLYTSVGHGGASGRYVQWRERAWDFAPRFNAAGRGGGAVRARAAASPGGISCTRGCGTAIDERGREPDDGRGAAEYHHGAADTRPACKPYEQAEHDSGAIFPVYAAGEHEEADGGQSLANRLPGKPGRQHGKRGRLVGLGRPEREPLAGRDGPGRTQVHRVGQRAVADVLGEQAREPAIVEEVIK